MAELSIVYLNPNDKASELEVVSGLMLAHMSSLSDIEPENAALIDDEVRQGAWNLRRWQAEVVQVRNQVGPLAMAAWFRSRNPNYRDTAFVNMVAAHPEHRMQGYGRTAMEATETRARRRGLLRIGLSSNEWSIDFYKKLGYAEAPGDPANSMLTSMIKDL